MFKFSVRSASATTQSATTPRLRSAGFTLTELLVVVSIITLLVAILLPALSLAQEGARRNQCASDRRGLAQSLFIWGNDYKDRVPTATGGLATANGYSALQPSGFSNWHQSNTQISSTIDMASQFATSSGVNDRNVFSMGTLVRKGYLTEARPLYCPSLDRNLLYVAYPAKFSSLATLWLDRMPANWNILTSGAENVFGTALNGTWTYMGIATHFNVAQRSPTRDSMRSLPNVTFDWIRDNYATRADHPTLANINNTADYGVSPILVSCNNFNPYSLNGFNLPAGNHAVDNGVGQCHNSQGLNVALIDGSARWVSRDEVLSRPWTGGQHPAAGYNTVTSKPDHVQAYMFTQAGNQGAYVNNFISWARVYDLR